MESKNHIIVDQLRAYFEYTPKEVIDRDFEEFTQYENVGPTLDEYLKFIKGGNNE